MEGILDLLKLGGQILSRVVLQLFAIVAQPRQFANSLDLNSATALVDASVFAVFVSIANLVISLSALLVAKIKADASTFVLIDTVLSFAFWFIYGSILHLCYKLFGGRGTYQNSMVVFLYMTAFEVLVTLFSLPGSVKIIPWILQSGQAPTANDWLRLVNATSESTSILLCQLLATAALIYRMIWVVRVFIMIHPLRPTKGVLVGLFGVTLWFLASSTVERSVMSVFLQAFRS